MSFNSQFNSQQRFIPGYSQGNFAYPSQHNFYAQMNPELFPINNNPYIINQNQQIQTENHFSQDQTFSQMIRHNLETNFFKIPEKFSMCLMEKIKPKLETHKEILDDCKLVMNSTENFFDEKFYFLNKEIEKVEHQINNLEDKTLDLLEKQLEQENLLQNFNNLNEEKQIERISHDRQIEQMMLINVNEVEMMKYKIQENILNIENKISNEIDLEGESLNEIKNLIIEKLSEVNQEIQNVNLKEEENFKTKGKYCDLSISVRKIKEVKNQLNTIKFNRNLNQIKREGLSLLSTRVTIDDKKKEGNFVENLNNYLNKSIIIRKKKDDLSFFKF